MGAMRRTVARAVIATALVLACAPGARAQESTRAADVPTRADVRLRLVQGDFVGARALLVRILAAEVSDEDRAAALDLSVVIDAWSATGRPKPMTMDAPAMPDPPPADWPAAFSATRDLLVAGAWAEASRRLDRLVASAPDPIAAARARALQDLARDLGAPPQMAPRTTTPTPTETRWYGWQTLLVDAVAAGLIVGGASTAPDAGTVFQHGFYPLLLFSHDHVKPAPLLDVGIALYTIGPAGVHAAHGRAVPAVESVAVRALGPTAGLVVGAVYGFIIAVPVWLFTASKDDGAAGAEVLGVCIVSGGVFGIVAPILLDSIALAREPVDTQPRPDGAALRVSPRIGFANGMPSLGLSGTF